MCTIRTALMDAGPWLYPGRFPLVQATVSKITPTFNHEVHAFTAIAYLNDAPPNAVCTLLAPVIRVSRTRSRLERYGCDENPLANRIHASGIFRWALNPSEKHFVGSQLVDGQGTRFFLGPAT